MRVFVPYTKIQPLTKHLLYEHDYTPVKMVNDLSYPKYWQERWDAHEDFVNVEHDVVFWPGAIEEISECPHIWCAYGRQAGERIEDGAVATFCLAKFSSKLTYLIPDVWKAMKEEDNDYRKAGVPEWKYCDTWLDIYAKRHGIVAHQHFPAIINANPTHIAKYS